MAEMALDMAKVQIEPLMADGLSDDVSHTFLCLDSDNCLAVNADTSLPVFIQNILNCVPEDEQSFYGFGTILGVGGVSDKWAILQKRPLFGMARCLKIYYFSNI